MSGLKLTADVYKKYLDLKVKKEKIAETTNNNEEAININDLYSHNRW